MQHRERRGGGQWVDTTQREIDWQKKRLACTTVSYANFAQNTEDSHAPGPTKDQHAVEALAAYGDSARQDLGPSA